MANERYDVSINGAPHTLELSAEDARRLGTKAQPVKQKARRSANKAKAPAANKAAEEPKGEDDTPASEVTGEPDTAAEEW